MITYRSDFGLWWPDYDHAPEKCLSFVRRGLPDMDLAVRLCRERSLCVQAGGHAGLWPLRLARHFDQVVTHECEPALFKCLLRNIDGVPNIRASDSGLGAFVGDVKMRPHCSAGSWRVDDGGTVKVRQVTIDSLSLASCSAIFLDVEGYEVEALKGASQTIERFSPVIHVEELPRSKAAIRDHLASLGYKLKAHAHNDFVYVR